MRQPLSPTPEQESATVQVCFDLTKMFLSIHIVRIDERTGGIYILAGDEVEVIIPRNGLWRFI